MRPRAWRWSCVTLEMTTPTQPLSETPVGSAAASDRSAVEADRSATVETWWARGRGDAEVEWGWLSAVRGFVPSPASFANPMSVAVAAVVLPLVVNLEGTRESLRGRVNLIPLGTASIQKPLVLELNELSP